MNRTWKVAVLFLVTVLVVPGVSTASFLIPQTPLNPSKIPQFVTPLPTHDITLGANQFVPYMLRTQDNAAAQRIIRMEEFYAKVLPDTFYAALPVAPAGQANGQSGTLVWGYRDYTPPSPSITSAGALGNVPAFNNVTYLGPTMLVPRGIYDNVWYQSRLGNTSLLQKYVTVDQSLKWADPFSTLCYLNPTSIGCPAVIAAPYTGPVPVAVHFHGTESPGKYDGGPDEWFTQDCGDACAPGGTVNGAKTSGPAFVTNQFFYENQQEPGTFFYHDHGLGITRTNVFSGLAAGYLILDNNTNVGGGTLGLATKPAVLNPAVTLPPFPTRWIPLVLQDRLFDTNGQFIFPDIGVNPIEHPFWVPEYFGNVIVVNGKAWPFLNVQPDQYRFSVVNGSNARVYNLYFTGQNAPAIWVIGTEQGYLDNPVLVPSLTIATGERYDIVIDFSKSDGKNYTLKNDARIPFPGGRPVSANFDGRIMEFRVAPLAKKAAPVLTSTALTATTQLRVTGKNMVNIRPTFSPTTQITRRLTLNEDLSLAGFPLEMLVNNTKYATEVGSLGPDVSEIPEVGDTEIWEIINLTADTHPMHTHLTAFQLLDRRPFNVATYTAAYNTANPAWGGVYKAGAGPPLGYGTCAKGGVCGGNPDPALFYLGPAVAAAGMELGWKDTVRMNPGEVTRILVRFAPTDEPAGTTVAGTNYYSFDPWEYPGYVWHCHIVDHEDNEMMRPLAIKCPAGATNCVKP